MSGSGAAWGYRDAYATKDFSILPAEEWGGESGTGAIEGYGRRCWRTMVRLPLLGGGVRAAVSAAGRTVKCGIMGGGGGGKLLWIAVLYKIELGLRTHNADVLVVLAVVLKENQHAVAAGRDVAQAEVRGEKHAHEFFDKGSKSVGKHVHQLLVHLQHSVTPSPWRRESGCGRMGVDCLNGVRVLDIAASPLVRVTLQRRESHGTRYATRATRQTSCISKSLACRPPRLGK
jgi:hypothetical protein